jgi:uncharacterized protein YbaP (TraB family)
MNRLRLRLLLCVWGWALALCLHAAEFGQGMLWHISKPGLADSWILGTFHLPDARIQPPASTYPTLARARVLAVELNLADPSTLRHIQRALLLPEDVGLDALLGPDYWQKLQQALPGQPAEQLRRLSPISITPLLMLPAGSTGSPLDLELARYAQRQQIHVVALETTQEQIRTLQALSPQQHATLLRSLLDHLDAIPLVVNAMIGAYRDEDLDTLARLATAGTSLSANPPPHEATALEQQFTHALLHPRNGLLLDRMEPLLQQGHAFIAVGALHLAGPQGLLAGLTQRGYTLRRLPALPSAPVTP